MRFLILFVSSVAFAAPTMTDKSLKLKGGIAVGDCAPQSTEKQYTCKTPHSQLPMTITFDDSESPYAHWTQTYHVGENWVRGDFEVYDNGDNFDISATLTVYGAEDRTSSATITLKTLKDFLKINTSSPPLPTQQGMKMVDLTIQAIP